MPLRATQKLFFIAGGVILLFLFSYGLKVLHIIP